MHLALYSACNQSLASPSVTQLTSKYLLYSTRPPLQPARTNLVIDALLVFRVFHHDGNHEAVRFLCLMAPRTQGSSITNTTFVQKFDSLDGPLDSSKINMNARKRKSWREVA